MEQLELLHIANRVNGTTTVENTFIVSLKLNIHSLNEPNNFISRYFMQDK